MNKTTRSQGGVGELKRYERGDGVDEQDNKQLTAIRGNIAAAELLQELLKGRS